jgi:CHASE3 domain sensor protein
MTEYEQQNPDLSNHLAELRATSSAEREIQDRISELEAGLQTEKEAHQAAIATAQE